MTCNEVIVTAVGYEDYFSNTGDSFFSDRFSSISDSCYRKPPYCTRVTACSCDRDSMLSWCDFLAGCIGGCAGVMVGHPLDTLKVSVLPIYPLAPAGCA